MFQTAYDRTHSVGRLPFSRPKNVQFAEQVNYPGYLYVKNNKATNLNQFILFCRFIAP